MSTGNGLVANDDLFDPPGQWVARGEFQQFVASMFSRSAVDFVASLQGWGSTRITGCLIRPLASSDQCRTVDRIVRIEDCFAGNREQGSILHGHAMCLATAEPESITIVEVPTSPMRCQTRSPSALCAGQFWSAPTTYCSVTIGPATINSPIFPRGISFVSLMSVDRSVVNLDHPPLRHLRIAFPRKFPFLSPRRDLFPR